MPIRQGFYGGAGQRAGEGFFTGLSELGDRMQQRQDQERASKRTLSRELIKDFSDRVIKGEMEAGDAEKAVTAQGMRVPSGYFDAFKPKDEDRLAAALGPTLAAKTPQEVQTTPAANLGLKRRGFNPISESNVPPEFGATFDQTNPDAASILNAARTQMMTTEKPTVMAKGMTGEGETATPTEQYGRFGMYPGQPAISLVGAPQSTGPSAGQAGAFKGREAVAAAPGTGAAQSTVNALTRPSEIQTETEKTKARLAQEYSPEMLALRTRLAGQEEQARQAAQAANVDYNAGRDETSTGLPYINLDKFVAGDQKFAAQAAGRNRIPVVRGPESELLKQGDQVRMSLQEVANLIPTLPPNILGLPLVELQKRAQANPQLAGVLSALQPAALGTARVMAGTTGFRSNRIEMERAIDAYLTATTAETKIVQLSTINKLLANEEALHLLPTAKDRADYMRGQTAPAPVPLQPGQRAYRFGRSTYLFNKDGSLAGTVTPAGQGQGQER